MVSSFLGLTVQLSSAPAKYKMKRLSFHRAPHTWQAGVAAAATASSGESRSLPGTGASDRGRGGHRADLAAGGHSRIHPLNRQSRVVCKSDAERGDGNSVTAEKGKQPGELLSGQMDSRVTGHQISHTVPHKAAGWH